VVPVEVEIVKLNVTPSRIDTIFIWTPFDEENTTWSYTIQTSKTNLASVECDEPFTCEIVNKSQVIVYYTPDPTENFGTKEVSGELRIVDEDDQIATLPVAVTVVNTAFTYETMEIPAVSFPWATLFFEMDDGNIVGFRLWWIGLIGGIALIILLRRFAGAYL